MTDELIFWSFLMFNNIMQLNYINQPPQLKLHSYPSVHNSCSYDILHYNFLISMLKLKTLDVTQEEYLVILCIYFSGDLEILFLFAVTSPEDINISTLSTLFSKSSRYSSPLPNSMMML